MRVLCTKCYYRKHKGAGQKAITEYADIEMEMVNPASGIVSASCYECDNQVDIVFDKGIGN